MIRREKESNIGRLITKLQALGLSNEEFNIHVVDIIPLADGRFRSGDRIQVRGSKYGGTLGCFAKLQKKEEDRPKIVAVTARHVTNVKDTDNKVLEVNNETLGKVMDKTEQDDDRHFDIAIGEVTAPRSKCDTYFRNEKGQNRIAEFYESDYSDLVNKRVHLWGACTSLGKAKLSDVRLAPSDAGNFIFISMSSNEEHTLAKEGDSGAMLLMERYPRDSPNMYAIGTLVGEVQRNPYNVLTQSNEAEMNKMHEHEQASTSSMDHPIALSSPAMQAKANEKLYAVVPLREAFDHLSKKHDCSVTLFTISE